MDTDVVVLLIGNDWKKKGLACLLRATALLPALPLRLIVVGTDDPAIFRSDIHRLHLADRIRFERPSRDVMRFYAAADLYAGPSLEDAFNLPILEAMACGLPVIASGSAGVAERVQDGISGFILSDPLDAHALSKLLQRLDADRELRQRIGTAASSAASQWTWDKNVSQLAQLFTELQQGRRGLQQ